MSRTNMKTIQIRNVPDDLDRALRERAREGTTMSALILAELPRLAARPSAEQLLARVGARTSVQGMPAADLIAAERAER